ncbi:hypothetical protein ZIOFF_001281 [Zingiber officinale]|uniref:Uncharacterized protein n=1 Tax=Zingiber officinale TaxID=94328 RepID=A0A8J5I9K4_ZINOF|nr:hypothetical protein ZIOFF_001281 [Zingiber officinale]
MNHQEEVLNEEGLLHGEEELVVLLTPIGTLKIRMTEMKDMDMDMEEVVVEADVKAVNEVETLDGVEYGIRMTKDGEGNLVNPTYYKSLTSCLRYLTCTRPDILFGVGLVSRYMETPKTSHLYAAKRILKYIKGAIDYGLLYSSTKDVEFFCFSDSDWARSYDDRKSTTGYVFYLGNTAFTWSSKKQSIVALSTCETEYIVAASCVCHAIWLKRLLQDLKLQQEAPTKIYLDNKSAIALAKNPVHHERSEHIDTRIHFIREYVKSKEIELLHVKSSDQVADIFTKPLKAEAFQHLRNLLGLNQTCIPHHLNKDGGGTTNSWLSLSSKVEATGGSFCAGANCKAMELAGDSRKIEDLRKGEEAVRLLACEDLRAEL